MEITNEIKAKVFAQYLGQMVEIDNYGSKGHPRKLIGVGGWDDKEYITLRLGKAGAGQVVNSFYLDEPRFKLILKPLSAITDEDAIVVSDIIGGGSHLSKESQIAQARQLFSSPNFFVNQTNISGYKWLQAIQFLQSKGYDFPHYLLGGKTLHEVDLAIYE